MVALNPFLATQLPTLGGVCEAVSLALCIPVEDGLLLGADWRLDMSHYEVIRRCWATNLPHLRAGQHVTAAPDTVLLPLLGPGNTLLAALAYVGVFPEAGSTRVFLDETLTRFARLLANPLDEESIDDGLLNLVPFDLEGDTDEVEERTYSALLSRCGWDVTVAAAALGITRQSLYERLEELNVKRLPPETAWPRTVND